MTKQNEIDKLAQDAAAARAAGMSYGKWKAMLPVVPIEPKPPLKSFAEIEYVCEQCGCRFFRYDHIMVKYCGERCRNAAYREKRKERSCNNGGKE